MTPFNIIQDPVGETPIVYRDNPYHKELCEEIGQGVILIKDARGEAIGFERRTFKPRDASQELGVV